MHSSGQHISPPDQLMQTMDRIYRLRMTTTSGGRLSIRDERGNVWVTPSRIDKETGTRKHGECATGWFERRTSRTVFGTAVSPGYLYQEYWHMILLVFYYSPAGAVGELASRTTDHRRSEVERRTHARSISRCEVEHGVDIRKP